MALSIKTNRMLWGRAASRCSLPDCRRELVIDPIETDDPSLVGEAAHIVAEQPDGPRGNSDLSADQRNSYANLVLLCNVHHKQADDQPAHFTVKRLKTIKANHERWVRESLAGFDPARQQDDERWAAYIEEWTTKSHLNEWLDQTYSLLQAQPGISAEFLRDISSLREWILSRVWPERYPGLRSALENFRRVLGDFVNVFERYAEPRHEDAEFLRTKKIYQIEDWDPPRYELLSARFHHHVDLVQDLTYELTRAANYICEMVRKTFEPTFRVAQGVLLVRRGMDMDMMERTHRLEYTEEEKVERPYPGLDAFLDVRATREFYLGSGKDPTVGDPSKSH
ncbi:MAG TPA: HNH endonuclease [Bryobacteraceae bacterium]|jgi:hypothetical protein|nr:HNH endonuclease [Bryobacteraceae bacterium]